MVWLVNQLYYRTYKKSAGGFKSKVLSLLKTNVAKQTVYVRGKKIRKMKTQSKINSIKNPFILNEKKEIQKLKLE